MRRMIRRFGFDIYGHMAGGRIVPWRIRSIPPRGPLRPDSGRGIATSFEVDLDDCTSLVGFSYRTGGWNPHVATLREHMADPSLRYEDSSLHRLYQSYQPRTLQEVFLEDVEEPLHPLSSLPVVRPLYRYVWTLNPKRIRGAGAAGDTVLKGHQYFGPMPPQRGQAQFDRLLDTFRSIRDEGFRPDRYGSITGYFVADESEYRFVVGAGNHRLAALKVLGHTSVPVGLSRSHPALIHRSELDSWTIDRGGPFEPETALALFDRFMTEDGTAKALRIGAIDPESREG